jgi:hypothetical protein
MRTCALFLLLTMASFAASPILKQDFEQDEMGWLAIGGESKIQITHDPSLVKNGKGSLEFRYEASGAKPSIAVLPARRSLTGMKSLNLWLMSDAETVAAVALIEENGGRYAANFWLEANTWQRVELTPEDFVLMTGANDPKDPDGRLDLDQIKAIAIVDVSQMFVATGFDTHAPIAVADHSGPHTLWMDDFEVSPNAPSWDAVKAAFLIDDYRAPQINWFSMGGASLKLDSSGSVMKGNTIRIDCNQMSDRFVIVTHMLPAMDLRGATHLAFDIVSDKVAHLILALQEKSDEGEGPRYHIDLEVPGGNKAVHRELAFSAFELAEDGPKDPDHKLDLDKLKAFSIVNVTAAYTGEDSINTIRIGKMEAIKAK